MGELINLKITQQELAEHGMTSLSGTKWTNQAEMLKTKLDEEGTFVAERVGQILDLLESAVAAANIGANVASVPTKTVQAILSAFESRIADRYTKAEVDHKATADTNNLIDEVGFDPTNGIMTFTRRDASTFTLDIFALIEQVPTGQLYDERYFKNIGGVIDGGENTTVTIKSDDSGMSLLELIGDSQGTGRVYVGQNESYGGGIEYNGDGSPDTTGTTDDVVLFRRQSGTDYWTARNTVGSNDWEFRGKVSATEFEGDLPASHVVEDDTHQFVTAEQKANLGGLSSIEQKNIPIKAGETLSVYDIVDIVNGEAQKDVVNRIADYVTTPTDVESFSDAASICVLSEDTFLLCWAGDGGTGVFAVLGRISEDAVIFGEITTIETDESPFVEVRKLTESKAVLIYQDVSSLNCSMRILAVSKQNSSVSFGVEAKLTGSTADYSDMELAVLRDDLFVVVGRYINNTAGVVVACSVVGSTITYGNLHTFNADSIYNSSICKLDETTFAVAFTDEADVDKGKAFVGTVDGTTITQGAIYTYANFDTLPLGDSDNVSITALSSKKVFITYTADLDGDSMMGVVGDITNGVITFGTEKTLSTDDTRFYKALALSNDKVLILYSSVTTDDTHSVVCDIAGTTITVRTPNTIMGLASGSSNTQDVALINAAGKVLHCYLLGDDIRVTIEYVDFNDAYEAIVTAVNENSCDVIYSGILSSGAIPKGVRIQSGNPKSVIGYAPKPFLLAVQGHWERG